MSGHSHAAKALSAERYRMNKVKFQKEARTKLRSNFALESDAVRQRIVSCCVRAPRGSARRYANMKEEK
jgi:hypothetical protein